MKKLLQKIKLRSFKTGINREVLEELRGDEYFVCYDDRTWEEVFRKEDLMYILKKDPIKPIRYVFDKYDRIIVDRDILIDEVIE